MTKYTWPRNALAPRRVTAQPVPGTQSGGISISGLEQVIASDAGFWRIVLDEIPLASRNQKREWNAMAVRLQGRLNLCDVPIYDDSAPWPIVGGAFERATFTPHSDDTPFGDESLYETDTIVATVESDVAAGAASMDIRLSSSGELFAGMSYSVVGVAKTRLYRIIDITAVAGEVYTCSIWPPAREAITATSEANFNNPVVTCRLASDTEMDSGADDYAGRTLAKVTFIEALP